MKVFTQFLFISGLALVVSSAASASSARLELRRVVDCGRGAKPIPYENGGKTEQLCVSSSIIFDQSDIIDARRVSMRTLMGTPPCADEFLIVLGHDGAARLDAVTRDMPPMTGRLGIVLDGKLVAAFFVVEPLTGNSFQVTAGGGRGAPNPLDTIVAEFGGGRDKP